MMNVLVTGGNGQLGQAIRNSVAKYDDLNTYFTDIEDLDITSEDEIGKFLKENNIHTIINCAAYTAVDKAETDQDKASLINVKAIEYLAKQARQNQALLVHISTDYVFDGKSIIPYKETDIPNPNSFYGLTKLQSEQKIEQFSNQAIIIRTSWLYSEFGHNFVKTMIKYGIERESLKVVNDQFGSPTYAIDLAEVILKLIQKNIKGVNIFNYSNEGSCTWYEFAKAIMEIKQIDCEVHAITTEEFPTAAARPKYSLLDKSKIKESLNIEIPHWKKSLQNCLKQL
jgi:dTDP-4-dehydrorhamnose reductase